MKTVFDIYPNVQAYMDIIDPNGDLKEVVDNVWGSGFVADGRVYFDNLDHARECAEEFKGYLGGIVERTTPPPRPVRIPYTPKHPPLNDVLNSLATKAKVFKVMQAVRADRGRAN